MYLLPNRRASDAFIGKAPGKVSVWAFVKPMKKPTEEVYLNLPRVLHWPSRIAEAMNMQQNSDTETVVPKAERRAAHTGGIVAFATSGSKVIGLLRERVLAEAYGTGVVMDAFVFSSLASSNIFVLLGGLNGPIDSSVVAVLASKDSNSRGAALQRIARITLMWLLALSVVLAIAAPIAVPWLAQFYHAGLVSHLPIQRQLAHEVLVQLYLMIPTIALGGLLGVFYAIARLQNKVFAASMAPAIASLVIVVFVWTANKSGVHQGWPIALAVLIGALAQVGIQIPSYLAARKCTTTDSAVVDEDVSKYKHMVAPAVLSTSVGMLSINIDAAFAGSVGAGAWSSLCYATRLIQVPLGILNTAVLVPMFPKFASSADSSNKEALRGDLHRCLKFIWFVTLPTVAMIAALSEPLVRMLLASGNFNESSVRTVGHALLFLAPQMLFYMGRELITRIFWAFRDSKTPFRVVIFACVLNALLDGIFVRVLGMGIEGIALSTTLVSAASFLILILLLRTRLNLAMTKLISPFVILLLAASVCWLACHFAFSFVSVQFGSAWHLQALALLASMALGALSYFGCCWVLKVSEVKVVIDLLRHLTRLKT